MNPVRHLIFLAALLAPAAARADPPSLRVMTYNLNYANPDYAATLDAIAKEGADIVLLQEVGRPWQDALAKRFAKTYPHQVFRLHARTPGGLAVLSKVAITAEELLPSPPESWFPGERIVIDSPLGSLQLLNVHLRPAIDRGSWIRGYQTTPPLRLQQVKAFWPRLAQDLPTIIAGDFNEEPSGTAIAFFAKRGLVRVPTTGPRTWRYSRGALTLLAMDIDHVLLDGHLAASDAHVLDAGTSDHRPVVVTLVKK
jgi:endonuclease/exonuclease/phosphatase (EEP) superfamily protein YafD